MEQVFRALLNMSYTGSIVILAVLILRVLLKAAKAPAWISYALWSAALFRLLCPFSLQSALALLPSTSPIPQGFTTAQQPAIHTGFEVLNTYVNPALSQSLAPASPAASANPAQILFFIGGVVWFLGAAAVLLSGAVSAVKLRHSLRFAVRAQDGVYESESLSTAFVWGVFRPRIYMPAGLNAQSRAHMLSHEKTHIKRLDHIAKLLFFLAAAVHWFNPLAWLCFRLFEKDMELSCDESVLAHAGEDIRKPYSETLLAVSARRARGFSPISFGESAVKSRIKHALSYKKPALWVVVGAVVLAAALGVTLVLNPLNAEQRIDFIEGGKPVSSVPLEGNESALEILRNAVFGQMLLSAAWPAEDMANYPDRIDVYARFSTLYPEGGSASEDDELRVYHVFEKDGRPCFQMGTMWSFMPDETYAAVLSLKQDQ